MEEEQIKKQSDGTEHGKTTTTTANSEQDAAAEEDVIAETPAAATATAPVDASNQKKKRKKKAVDNLIVTMKRKKPGRKSNVDVESYNNTLQELQKNGIVEKFCSMAVMCSVCNNTINMRQQYYLYYWTNHERSVTHQKQLFVRHNNPELFEQQQQMDNAKKKRNKAMESFVAISATACNNKNKDDYDPDNVRILLSKSDPCEGLIPYYDNLERDLTLLSLYCLDSNWYTIREDNVTGRKQAYAPNCPNGGIWKKHMKELNRCTSCREIREHSRKFYDLRTKIKKFGKFLTQIDTIIEKQYVEEDDISAINSFQYHNDKILTDFGKMRRHQINQLYQHYKSTLDNKKGKKKKRKTNFEKAFTYEEDDANDNRSKEEKELDKNLVRDILRREKERARNSNTGII